MSVPTRDQIVVDLRIPEVEKKYDRLGRPVEKKNFNYGRGTKIFAGNDVTAAEIRRVHSALYKG